MSVGCEAEEADTRVWLHDTDVYHIGLPLLANQPMDMFVHVSMFSRQEHRYLS